MSSLRIALAQCRQTADLDTNAATIFRMVEDAARQGVQILCFPGDADGRLPRGHLHA